MVQYEEKTFFALTFDVLVDVDLLVLNFKHASRNNNQLAQSLRFANSSKERGDYQSQR